MVLFLFLSHLAIGIVLTLLLVSREAGVKFFRFNAGTAALLLAAAFTFRPPEASASEWGRVAFIALIVLEVALTVYWATVGRTLASIRPAIVATGAAAGGVAPGRRTRPQSGQLAASSGSQVPQREQNMLSPETRPARRASAPPRRGRSRCARVRCPRAGRR